MPVCTRLKQKQQMDGQVEQLQDTIKILQQRIETMQKEGQKEREKTQEETRVMLQRLEQIVEVQQEFKQQIVQIRADCGDMRDDLGNRMSNFERQLSEISDRIHGYESKSNDTIKSLEGKIKDIQTYMRDGGVLGSAGSHSKLQPPNYDGQTSWTLYRKQFEAAALANSWTAQEKVTNLVLALRGRALDILQTLTVIEQHDLDTLLRTLDLRPSATSVLAAYGLGNPTI